jgi:hypothetical protein
MMYSDDNIELTREERSALAALPREMELGDLLESRVIRALRAEGHFGSAMPQPKTRASAALKIAAALTLFISGVATGRYVLASRAPETATITAPVTGTRGAGVSAPLNNTRPAQRTETVVAEREMWL